MRNSESLYPAFPWNEAQMHYFPALGLGGWAEAPPPERIIHLKSALHFCNRFIFKFAPFWHFFRSFAVQLSKRRYVYRKEQVTSLKRYSSYTTHKTIQEKR